VDRKVTIVLIPFTYSLTLNCTVSSKVKDKGKIIAVLNSVSHYEDVFFP